MSNERFKLIKEEIDSLLNINTDNLDVEALKGTKIFSKIYEIYVRESTHLASAMSRHAKVELLRFRYYTGKADPKMYKEDRFLEAITKTDVDKYLKADDMIIESKSQVDEQEKIVKFLEESLKSARSRQYDIKAAIEWKRLTVVGS